MIVALISWAFLGEKMNVTKLAGIFCAVCAVILIS
jgi:drug/metabolite transporter (DMT)-like permease